MYENVWLDYIIFGLVDNFVVILGGVLGISIEALLPERFKMGLFLPIIACGISNAVSDCMGGLASGNYKLAFGTFIGCLLAFIFLPVMLFIKRKFRREK